MNSIIEMLYKSITWILYPLTWIILRWRVGKGKEDPGRYLEKMGIYEGPSQKPVVWIHGVSIGESRVGINAISILQKIFPHVKFLLTSGTVGSATVFEKLKMKNVSHCYIPLDTPQAISKFYDHWQPQVGFFVGSELWPNLCWGARKRNIPLVMLNGIMSDRSARFWGWINRFMSPLLKSFALCFAQDKKQMSIYEKLGAPRVVIGHNLKLLAKAPFIREDVLDEYKNRFQGRQLFLGASVHPGEYEKLIDLLPTQSPEFLLILAPRHMTSIPLIIECLKIRNIAYGLHSEGRKPTSDARVYIVDTFGDLGLFYALCPQTFVGATWISRGGHNPIEAAQMGAYVFHGPHTDKNQDLFDYLKEKGWASEVVGVEDLAHQIKIAKTPTPIDWQAQRLMIEEEFTQTLKSVNLEGAHV